MAISNKTAKKIRKGLKDRVKSPGEVNDGSYAGVPLYRKPSAPKPATLTPTYDRASKKLKFR